jgi:hypothetical protein
MTANYFKNFSIKGHTYYLGKYDDLDVFIVWEPQDEEVCDELNCSGESRYGAVSTEIADLIFSEIVLKSLGK